MNIETKYALQEEVYFMPGQTKKVKCAEVIKIEVVIERTGLNGGTTEQREKYTMQGGYGPVVPHELFPTRQDLLNSL